MKKFFVFLSLLVASYAYVAFAGDLYAGTVSANSLNISSVYDVGTVLADGGCPTDGGRCVRPFFTTTGVQVGSRYVLQNTLGFCYCQNQVDPATLTSNCSLTNCVQVDGNVRFSQSCDSTTSVRVPALLSDGGAALLSDGGTRYAGLQACVFYVVADSGVKVFYDTGR